MTSLTDVFVRLRGPTPETDPRDGKRRQSWEQDYFNMWGKAPGEPLTPDELAAREPLWNAEVAKRQRSEALEQARRLACKSGLYGNQLTRNVNP